jgi:hypothetical protein
LDFRISKELVGEKFIAIKRSTINSNFVFGSKINTGFIERVLFLCEKIKQTSTFQHNVKHESFELMFQFELNYFDPYKKVLKWNDEIKSMS